MKRIYIKLILVLCSLNFSANAQEQQYFYYYKNQKQYFSVNTQFAYVQLSQKATVEELQQLWQSKAIKVKNVSIDNVPLLLVNSNIDKENNKELNYYASVEFKKEYSVENYFNILEELETYQIVDFCLPYLRNDKFSIVPVQPYVSVRLHEEEDKSILEELGKMYHFEIVGTDQYMPKWYNIRVTNKTNISPVELAALLHETQLFKAVEPAISASKKACEDDDLFPEQWGLKNTGQPLVNIVRDNGATINVQPMAEIDINACDAWDITKGSNSVVVSVVDDGVELSHPELSVISSFNATTGVSPSGLYGNHGTRCAGIIKAAHNNIGNAGVAPDCGLMSISIDFPNTSLGIQEARAINESWQRGADVISCSWLSKESAKIDEAINNALTQGRNGLGCIVVFATLNEDSPTVAYPANSDPRILAVGALSPCAERCSDNSCDGENWGSNYGDALDIVAPGVMIPTTDINGGTMSHFWGTSAATPHVAGVAALILSINPCLTEGQVRDIIEYTAQKVGYSYSNTAGRPNGTWHREVGYGLVDAFQSLLHTNTLFLQNQTDTGTEGYENIGSIRTGNDIDPIATTQTGDYVVGSGADVILKATEEIKLQAGTKIVAGSNFRAYIDNYNGNCNDWLLTRTAPVDNPTIDDNIVVIDKSNNFNENIEQQVEINIYPNPFENNFNLGINLAQSDDYSLNVFNATGQLIYNENGQLDMGKHLLNIPINQGNGLCIVRLQIGDKIITKKLMKYE